MRSKFLHKFLVGTAFFIGVVVVSATTQPPQTQSPGSPDSGQGRRMRGMGGFPGGNGVLGTVTEVTADHYTIKTDAGESYTVHYSVNTRILKQAPGQGQGRRQGAAAEPGGEGGGDRPAPQTLKPTEIKVVT